MNTASGPYRGVGVLVFVGVWFACSWAMDAPAGDDGGTSRIIAVPRSEAGQVMESWLIAKGHKVVRSTEDGDTCLVVVQAGKPWRIVLRQMSPLATEVIVSGAPQGAARDLWQYLDAYVHKEGAPARDGQETPPSVVRRVESVVCIVASVRGKPIQISGFVVDRQGLVLCTAHMLKDPEEITVIARGGARSAGRIVKIDFGKDLALIDSMLPGAEAVALVEGDPVPAEGMKVYSIGCPLNHGGTIASGVVSGPPRLVEGHVLVQALMEVEPGSSGSPVFDEAGALVGVVQGRMKTDRQRGLIVPLDTVVNFVRQP